MPPQLHSLYLLDTVAACYLHFLFTCEIYRLETFMPALCSATYFFISSYVALVSADVISTSSSSKQSTEHYPYVAYFIYDYSHYKV